jgi:hypothetical protein
MTLEAPVETNLMNIPGPHGRKIGTCPNGNTRLAAFTADGSDPSNVTRAL